MTSSGSSPPPGSAGASAPPHSASDAAKSDPLVGQRLGPCLIEARLAAGAMGVVYRARHEQHGVVCVKVVGAALRAAGGMLRRFQREAEAARRIDHPNVVRGYGLVEADGQQLLVQELVTGGDVDGLLRRRGGRLPVREAVRLCGEVARGLAAAHAAGLIHRDLKPGNVMLDAASHAKVADFGLVLQVDGEPLDGRTILTRKGQALGTPLYMAPEQWQGAHDVDGRADVYALGVMLHHLIAGRPPFEAKSITDLMRLHIEQAPLPLRRSAPHAPEAVERLVLRLLAKDAASRPTAAEAADELERLHPTLPEDSPLDPTVRVGPARTAVAGGSAGAGARGAPGTAPSDDPGTRPLVGGGGTPAHMGTPPPAGGGTPPPPLEPLVGSVIGGKLRIASVLGRGGMGVVYRARHTLLDSDFAVKLIHAAYARDPEFRARFLREAKALLAFVHEGAVSLRDFGEHEGALYMALDFAPGESLSALLKRDGAFDEARALGLARQVLPCLAKAHEAGLVHRDLKPQNLVVERRPDGTDRARVLDFGIAKLLHDVAAAGQRDGTLTGTGSSIGTPHYMSPEQSVGDPVDARADIYAFGCVLYEAVSGRRPIEADTAQKLHHKVLSEVPPGVERVSRTKVSPAFAAAVTAALRKDRDERPANATAFLAMLEGRAPVPRAAGETAGMDDASEPADDDAPATGRSRGRAVAAVVGLLLVAGAVAVAGVVLGGPGGGKKGPGGEVATGGDASGTGTGTKPPPSSGGDGSGGPTPGGPIETPAKPPDATPTPTPGTEPTTPEGTGAAGTGTTTAPPAGTEDPAGTGTKPVEPTPTPPIEVRIDEPADGAVTNRMNIDVRGTVSDPAITGVLVNGVGVRVRDGKFTIRLAVPAGGEQLVEVRAEAGDGRSGEASVRVTLDVDAPSISGFATEPTAGAVTRAAKLRARGKVIDDHPRAVRVAPGGAEVAVAKDGAFDVEVSLASGTNDIAVTPIDAAGNAGQPVRASVERDADVPVLEITEKPPALTRSASQRLRGKVTDAHATGVDVRGARLDVRLDAKGAFDVAWPLDDGENRVTLVARDAAGAESKPVEVACTLDRKPPVIQLDAAPPAETEAASVAIRGRVVDEDGKPEAGLAVSIGVAGARPGQVRTDRDGKFDTTVSLASGLNRIKLDATDAAGNATATVDIAVTRRSDVGDVESVNTRWGLVLVRLRAGASAAEGSVLAVKRGDSVVGRLRVAKVVETDANGRALVSTSPEGGASADSFQRGDRVSPER